MLICGNGITNIFRADATNHFGPIMDLKGTKDFLESFVEKWDTLKHRVRIAGAEELAENVFDLADVIFKGLEKGKTYYYRTVSVCGDHRKKVSWPRSSMCHSSSL